MRAEVSLLGGLALVGVGFTGEFLPPTSWFYGYSNSMYVAAGVWWVIALLHFGFARWRERDKQVGAAASAPPAPEEFAIVLEQVELAEEPANAQSPASASAKASPFPDQEFADWLTEKYEYGVHKLLNGPIDTPQEFAALLSADDAWVREIGLELVRHGATRQEWVDFNFLQEVPVEPRFHAEPQRDHLRRMINVRLNRLKKAIDRYSERPTFHVARGSA